MNDKIKNKIEKLLKLSESPNESEAQAAIEKAYTLLAKYNIKESELGSAENVIVEKIVFENTRIMNWKKLLLTGLSDAFFCYNLYKSIRCAKFQKTQCLVIGRPHNIEITLSLFDYCVNRIDVIAKEKYKNLGRSFITNYKYGMAANIAYRLETNKQKDFSDNEYALVISHKANESKLIAEYLNDNNYNSIRTSKSKTKINNALYLGYEDGNEISLSTQIKQESENKQLFLVMDD